MNKISATVLTVFAKKILPPCMLPFFTYWYFDHSRGEWPKDGAHLMSFAFFSEERNQN